MKPTSTLPVLLQSYFTQRFLQAHAVVQQLPDLRCVHEPNHWLKHGQSHRQLVLFFGCRACRLGLSSKIQEPPRSRRIGAPPTTVRPKP